MTVGPTRSATVAVATILDRWIPEPGNEWHPTAIFGRAMTWVETRIYRPNRLAGIGYATIGCLVGAVAGRLVGTGPALVASLAGTQLRTVASDIEQLLADPDPTAARSRMPWLVGRDASALDHDQMAAAVIESLAENTVDAVIGPMFWAVVGGGQAVGLHRACNTMDAMVGHRSPRLARFGTAAARLDDVANYLPARVFVVLLIAARPDRAGQIIRAVRTTASRHPSPNAGVAEAAVAGALDRELGGPLRYGERIEARPRLGSGPRPRPSDIGEAVHLVRRVETLAAAALGLHAMVLARRSCRSTLR